VSTIISIVSFLFRFYSFLFLIRVLLSWVSVNRYGAPLNHPLLRFLYRVTDPLLKPLQRMIPPIGGMFDISPIVVLILLEIARVIVLTLLSSL
jgi:YggT family protein